jgi:bacillithiol biosynthesis deacetylase BshB1
VTDRGEAVDVIAFGAHADDVELGCGGTLAALARLGRTFGIVDLTRGEMGTRGTPELRAREAAEAARILGARFRETLDLGDGNLRTDRDAQMQLVEIVRRRRPVLVLAPWTTDRHPDHERAARLVKEATWYAGLKSLATDRPPHRPQQLVYYPTSYVERPTVLVDISHVLEVKLEAMKAYRSQFFDAASAEPETFISARGFVESFIARSKGFGLMANVEHAEGFVSLLPPTAPDLVLAFDGYEPGSRRAPKLG